MIQLTCFTSETAVSNQSGAVEADTISKTGGIRKTRRVEKTMAVV